MDDEEQILECMKILRKIYAREVSASMSNIEYYFEYVYEAKRRLRAEKEMYDG